MSGQNILTFRAGLKIRILGEHVLWFSMLDTATIELHESKILYFAALGLSV